MMAHDSVTASEERALGRRIEAAGWGVFFLWVGIALLANLGWGVGLIGVGAITLGGQAWRSLVGVKVERFSVTIGVLLVIAGIWKLLDLRVDLLPLLFIAAGVGILASTWRSRHAHGHDAGVNPPAHPRAP